MWKSDRSKFKQMDLPIISVSGNGFFSHKLSELPEEAFKITLVNSQDAKSDEERYPDYPLADSEIFHKTKVISAKKLTHGDNVKEVFLLELPSHGRMYEPGDTIGIIPQNADEDLVKLFNHLKISNLVHRNCKVSQENPDKKLITLPVFVNQLTTIYNVFQNFIDIRCIPKKSLIRVLAEYTKDDREKRVLEELCSKEFKRYEEEILENNKTFIDLILSFPSCCPPVERLLENLPQLQPRLYSIASSPLSNKDTLKIVFTVAKPVMNGVIKEGICTGMLKSIISQRQFNNGKDRVIKMFYRKPGIFRLPEGDEKPLILIGPGSGIAPFIGFLEHRKILKSKGIIWLFYGCRYKFNDYLFKTELENYLNCGVLSKLFVSFSREPGESCKYVQDNLKSHGKEICDIICDKEGIIYVCGDAKGLRKDVMNSLISIVQEHTGRSFKDANNLIKSLQKDKRYLQDVWL